MDTTPLLNTQPPPRPPKVSILIPNYNYGRFLPFAIQSVLDQEFQDYEILISDNGSTDDSISVISAFAQRDPRIRFHVQSENLGMVGNWNWCLREARGDYIQFLFGDDCLASPHALRTLVALLDNHPSAVLATSARQVIDAHGQPQEIWDRLKTHGLHPSARTARLCLYRVENCIGEPSAVLFRSSATQGRGFDPSFRQLVDLEMWLHLLKSGDLLYTPATLCKFRRHEAQQTEANRTDQIGYHEHIRLCQTYLPIFSPANAYIPLAEKLVIWHKVQDLESIPPPHAARLIIPVLTQHLGIKTYKIGLGFYKLCRPLLKLRRSWNKRMHRASQPTP